MRERRTEGETTTNLQVQILQVLLQLHVGVINLQWGGGRDTQVRGGHTLKVREATDAHWTACVCVCVKHEATQRLTHAAEHQQSLLPRHGAATTTKQRPGRDQIQEKQKVRVRTEA